MNKNTENFEQSLPTSNPVPQGYFIPMQIQEPKDQVNLLDLWAVLVNFKRLIAIVVLICVSVSVIAGFSITPMYKATILLAPAASDNKNKGGIAALASQFGGLASLAGVSVGGGGDMETAIATLKSRKFITNFISDQNLKPLLFESKWDIKKKSWILENKSLLGDLFSMFHSSPETRKFPGLVPGEPSTGATYHKFNYKMLSVSQNKKTQLLTVSIMWGNPNQASEWVNALIKRLNEELRQKTIGEAERSIDYLTEQINQTSLSELQNMLYRLIEEHTKIITLAKVNHEYVFKVIDPAVPPEIRSKPDRKLLATLGLSIGVIFGVILAFFLNTVRISRSS